MSFDKLPTKAELVFRAARKSLHLRLSGVLQSLSVIAAEYEYDAETMRIVASHLRPSFSATLESLKEIRSCIQSNMDTKVECLLFIINHIALDFREFVVREDGYKRYTKKVDKGIKALEHIRDNWGSIVTVDDVKNGYEIGTRS